MPESIVSINEGTGKKLHAFQRTIGANDVQDEVVILGEQYLATYTNDPGASCNTTTINKHLIQVMAGASLNVYIRWIGIYQTTLAGAATLMNFQIRRLTTAGTGGTAATWRPLDSTDTAAGMAAMTMPTALGTEGVSLWSATCPVVAAVPAVPLEDGMLIWQWPPPSTSPLVHKTIRIPAGTTNGICLKNTAALATAAYSVIVIATEANF